MTEDALKIINGLYKKNYFFKFKKKWRYYKKYNTSFWIIGHFHNFSDLEILKLLCSINKRNIKKKISLIDGNFSIFVKTKNYSFVCVDRISSYPLLFSLRNNTIHIADNGKVITEYLKIKSILMLILLYQHHLLCLGIP